VGFDRDFLKYFASVDDDHSACGRARTDGSQTVVVDVNSDEAFAPHRDIAAASSFRAVVSTPLVDRSGALVGVVSVHFARPGGPSEHSLRILRHYGELAGETIANSARSPKRLYQH
jgi:GAF domain-containing protein